MKAGLLCLAGFAAGVVAQPQNNHRRFHNRPHQAREEVTEWVTQTAYAPAVTQYVDQNGNPIPAPAQAPSYAPAPAAPAYNAPQPAPKPVAPANNPQPAPKPTAPAYNPQPAPKPTAPAPKPTAPAPKPTSPAPSYGAPSSGGSGRGITWSPYTDNSGCKTQDQVNAEFKTIYANEEYSFIRVYGCDCNQVSLAINAIKNAGKKTKLIAGINDITNVEADVKTIAAAVNGDWSWIDTVSVGNEGVNSGAYSIGQVSAAVQTAKTCLSAVGYSGNVVTVDTFVAILAHPEMCNIGDYVAANCHAFFDGHITADGAGQFVQDQVQRLKAACPGKKVVITESGWPSDGETNQQAVPSRQNQQAAIASLKKSFSDGIFLFTAFNDGWKARMNNAANFNCETFWGFLS